MSRPGKSLRSSGRTRGLLNHKGAGKGSADRTFNISQYAKNRSGIRGLSSSAVGFHKSYGSAVGPGSTSRSGPLDRAQIDRSKKAWQKYEQEYRMLEHDCSVMNAEAGVDNQGRPLE